MQRTFVRDGVIYRDNGDGTATVIGYENQGTPLGPSDPTAPYQEPKAQADVARTQAQTQGDVLANQLDQSTLDARKRKAEADAQKAEIEAREARETFQKFQKDEAKKPEERKARIRQYMREINRLRQMADESLAVGTASQYVSATEENGGPGVLSVLFGQNRADVEAKLDSLRGDIIKAEMKERAEDNNGEGASTTANSAIEQLLAASGVAALNPNQSRERFEEALDTVQNYYLRQAAEIEGLPIDSKELRDQYINIGENSDDVPLGFSPPDGPDVELAQGETYSTPEDLMVAEEVQKVYNAGGSLRDMVEASEKLGRPVDLQRTQEWARAIDYRDAKGEYEGQRTGFATVNPAQSGRRSFAGQVYGDFARTGLGEAVIGYGTGAGNAVTLGGLDEVTGAIDSIVSGRDADLAIDYANRVKQNTREAAPLSYLLGETATALMGGAGAAKFGGNLATKAAQSPVITGALAGTAFGGLENNDNRAGGALAGGLGGGAGGYLGSRVLGPAINRLMATEPARTANDAIRVTASKALGRDLTSATPNPRISRGERAMMQTGDLPQSIARVREAQGMGLPYSLADSGENMRSLAGATARRSPEVRESITAPLDTRAANRNTRFVENVESRLAPRTNIDATKDSIRNAARIDSDEYYKKAFDRAGPVDAEIDAMMQTSVGREALQNAYKLAEAKGMNPEKIGFELNEQGEVFLREVPSFETYQLVKRGLDQVLEKNRNPVSNKFNTNDPAVEALQSFRTRFNNRLGQINDNYRKGNAAYAKQMRRSDALDRGLDAAKPKMRPDDVEVMLNRMPPQEREMLQRGFATGLSEKAQKAGDGVDPYRAALTDWNDQKIDKIFPGKRAELERLRDFERDMQRTHTETLGGSQTQPRARADEAFDDNIANATVETIATGGVPGVSMGRAAVQGLGRKFADNYRIGRGENTAKEIAPILFETDTSKIAQYAKILEQKAVEDYLRKTAYRRRGGLFGAAGGAGLGGGAFFGFDQ